MPAELVANTITAAADLISLIETIELRRNLPAHSVHAPPPPTVSRVSYGSPLEVVLSVSVSAAGVVWIALQMMEKFADARLKWAQAREITEKRNEARIDAARVRRDRDWRLQAIRDLSEAEVPEVGEVPTSRGRTEAVYRVKLRGDGTVLLGAEELADAYISQADEAVNLRVLEYLASDLKLGLPSALPLSSRTVRSILILSGQDVQITVEDDSAGD